MQVYGLKYGHGGTVEFARYQSTGEIAIRIIGDDGQPACVATVNIEQWGCDPAPAGHVWLKTWSENDGVDRALADAGVIERKPVKEVWGGYADKCRAALHALTPAALAELAASES